VVLSAIAVFAAMGDVVGLKNKLFSVAEARAGSATPEVQPPSSAVTAPREPPPLPKSKSKPLAKQASKASGSAPMQLTSASVPQIAAESPTQYKVSSEDKYESTPASLSRLSLPNQPSQMLPVVEAATNARLNAPGQPSQVVRSKLLVSPTPVYPEEARRAGVRGVVELDAVIDAEGRVKDIRVVTGHPLLIREAIRAAERQQYTPFLLNSVPQEVPTRIRFIFKP
jgi:TonB family protein